MKKILAMLLFVLGAQVTMSQSVVKLVWTTDFENGGAPPPCSDTSNYRDSTYLPCFNDSVLVPTFPPDPPCIHSNGHQWDVTNNFFFNGNYADTGTVNAHDTLWFTTCAFSTLADTFVTVEFQHIAKISKFDGGVVEVSNDNGLSWNRLGANEYINTKGAAAPRWNYLDPLHKYGVFNDLSYAHLGKWMAGVDSMPENTWWEYEYFNASAFLGGANSSANCKIRFSLFDGPTTVGPENYYGWILDSIRIKSSPCENIKPIGFFTNPQIFNGSIIYSQGPFDVYAKMWDENSGFSDAWLVYTVNGGFLDSVPMDSVNNPPIAVTTQDSIYRGVIPKYFNGGLDSLQQGDTVCYWVNVYDKSIPCRNQLKLPDDVNNPGNFVQCREFYILNGLKLPYCDDFDNPAQAAFWDTTMISGAIGWQLGNPAVGGYGPISPPNTWTTILAGNYQDGDEYYVNSPFFDFTDAVTPRISFWHHRQFPTGSSDGERLVLQYSENGNPWIQLGGQNSSAGKILNRPPNCPSTWYDQNNGWSGQFGPGPTTHNGAYNNQWREAFYQLPASFTGKAQVQFRFGFKADNNALKAYGASIDDWCIQNPPEVDITCIRHIRPVRDFIKKAGDIDSSVTVIIRNIGTDTMMSIGMEYVVLPLDPYVPQVPQIISTTITYPQPEYPVGLPPLFYDTAFFNTAALGFTVPEGMYVIKAYPTEAQDADSTNDTVLTIGHYGFISDTISHFNGFDTVPLRWTSDVIPPGTCGNPPEERLTRWEWGTPNWNITTGAYSPPNSWDINLDTAYTNDEREYLYTQIYDMTNADSAFLSFWHNRNTVFGQDGYWIDYSVNRGNTWTRLTAATQPIGRKVNWTNSYPPLASPLGAGWSGLTNAWEYSQCPLNNLTFTNKDEVMFRFVFGSDAAGTLDGVSVDDFRVVNPDLFDAEMFDIVLPERGCVKDIKEWVEVTVKNVGKKDTLIDVPVAYRYRFDATCSGSWGGWSTWKWDTIRQPILSGVTVQHIFKDSVNMSVFGCYDFCAVVSYSLDNNQENDTLCGHEAENVRGCDIDLKVTTGMGANNTPPDGEIIIQDSLTLDTLYIYPFSAIGPNVIQWQDDICLYDVGRYKFSITSSDTAMISWWRLRDPFADTTVAIGFDPGVTYFFWECPPLLSASAEVIRPYGPAKMPLPQSYNIDVRTRNKGSVSLRYFWITTEIRQTKPLVAGVPPLGVGPFFSQTDSVWTTALGDPILFPRWTTIDSVWHASPGEYEIKSWTFLPNGNADSATFDDTATLIFTILDTVSTMPYCNNFDDPARYPWASLSNNLYDTLSSFKLGTPNQTTLSSANSAPNSWMTGLSNDYPILDSSAVYSPEFEVDTTCFQINFDHIFDTEHAFDGGTVEYTLDSGNTWRTVGGTYNPLDTSYWWSTGNWHNTPYVTGLGGAPHPPGWSGVSATGWRYSFRDFKVHDNGQNPVKMVFRFRFGADASVNSEGWAFDDFCFQVSDSCKYYSCTDGIQNGFETGVDCGGECDPCESCTDGLWNQNEDDTDCGGVCPPCPSCVDNVLNGNETAPDCGGPDCDPCPSCFDGVLSNNWVYDVNPPPLGTWTKQWEYGIDCGGPCDLICWLGVDEIDPNILFLGQSVPNPAYDETKIGYQIPEDGMVTIKVISTLGVEVYNYQETEQRGIHYIDLDVSTWSAGIYYYSIEFNGERKLDKLVVRRE